MSIKSLSGGASSTAVLIKKPTLGDIPACADYARQASEISTKPYKTLAYIWSRFLIRSFLFSEKPKKQYTGWKVQDAFFKNEGLGL